MKECIPSRRCWFSVVVHIQETVLVSPCELKQQKVYDRSAVFISVATAWQEADLLAFSLTAVNRVIPTSLQGRQAQEPYDWSECSS